MAMAATPNFIRQHQHEHDTFHRSFSSPNCTWYRNGDSELSPKSDTDHSGDSDEDAAVLSSSPMSIGSSPPSSAFCITGESVFCPVSSPSAEIRFGSTCKPINTSLQIGRRSRAMGLKDIDLSNNPQVEYIRQAREANRSPTKSKRHMFTPVRQMSSPGALSTLGGQYMGWGTSNSPSFIPYNQVGRAALPPPNCHRLPNTGTPQPWSDASKNRLLYSTENVDMDGFSPVMQPESIQSTQSKNCRTTAYTETVQSTSDEDQEQYKTCQRDVQPSKQSACGGTSKSAGSGTAVLQSEEESPDCIDTSNLRHRRLPSKDKSKSRIRRGNRLGFSDDEDDDVIVEQKSKPKTEEEEPSGAASDKPKPTCSAASFCKVILVTLVLVMGTGLYVHVNPHSLCLRGEFRANLSGFEHALQDRLFGQHLAKKILVASLKSHFSKQVRRRKPLVFSFHGWTGIGKNFVSDIVADHLFKHGSQSPFVHKIIVPLHFPHEADVERYKSQLSSWITGNVSRCSMRALFIFDEMDKIPLRLVHTLKAFLDHRGTVAGVDYSNTVFLFLSNSGGNSINQHVLDHYREGKQRDQIRLRDLEMALHDTANNNAKTWYQELLALELIDHMIPFMPLERSHVKRCIRNNLHQKGYPVVETLVSEIADQMSYFPSDLQLFSRSGCKKVASRVDVAMG